MLALAHRRRWICAAACAAAALGGCGGSDDGDAGDEAQIRALAKQFSRSTKRDPERDCAKLTDRAKAQVAGLLGGFSGTSDCETLWARAEPDDAAFTAGDAERAALTIRGERALMKMPGADGDRVGMRKLDGEWKIDNIINPTLQEPARRSDPRLTAGSDEQQLRATFVAERDAFEKKDYARVCELFSYGGEAQLVFVALFSSDAEHIADPRVSCAAALRAVQGVEGEALSILRPSGAEVSAAVVTIRKGQASLTVRGSDPVEFVRQEGRWLIGPSLALD